MLKKGWNLLCFSPLLSPLFPCSPFPFLSSLLLSLSHSVLLLFSLSSFLSHSPPLIVLKKKRVSVEGTFCPRTAGCKLGAVWCAVARWRDWIPGDLAPHPGTLTGCVTLVKSFGPSQVSPMILRSLNLMIHSHSKWTFLLFYEKRKVKWKCRWLINRALLCFPSIAPSPISFWLSKRWNLCNFFLKFHPWRA